MKIHFIGIGGIGVSALAQYYLEKGHNISGSDLSSSEVTDYLQKLGVKINFDSQNPKSEIRNPKQISDLPDLIVFSPAVRGDNPELKFYREKGIKCLSYPEALGELTKEYYTIAVSGSHGKSTTTAMIALVLIKAGLDPTVIVGTKLKEFGDSNFRAGKSKYLVIEACEYDSSFLHYEPKIIVVTNIDKEHLDYFKTFANVRKAFKDFIARLPKDGFLVNKENKKDLAKLRKILKVPGYHNVLNASMALQVARILEIRDDVAFEALAEFTGTWRRFEILKTSPYVLISDYGHHPNEIKATLKAAREKYKDKKIWCVFQPHQHQRTHYLFNDFIKVFRPAKIDKIIITDIYGVVGREVKKINKEVSAEKLVNKISRKSVVYCATNELEKFIKENIKSFEVLIIMGAGDIYKLPEKF